MFSEENEGYKPALTMSNPLILNHLYKVDLIVSLNLFQHYISQKESSMQEFKSFFGFKPVYWRFIEIPTIFIA